DLCPAPVPPVLAGREQDAGVSAPAVRARPARATSNFLRRPAGAVPTTGSSALKQAAPAVSAALAAIVAGRSIHLDLLLDDRAPAQGAQDGQYINYLANHGDPPKVWLASFTVADQAVIAVFKCWKCSVNRLRAARSCRVAEFSMHRSNI